MPITDKQMVSFLYTIIKQLEIRYVDWELVARCNDIARGHTARMRFHRLRQAQDGLVSKPRIPVEARTKAKNTGKQKNLEDIVTDDEECGSDIPLAKMRKRKAVVVKNESDGRDEMYEGKGEGRVVRVKLEDEDITEEAVKVEDDDRRVHHINGSRQRSDEIRLDKEIDEAQITVDNTVTSRDALVVRSGYSDIVPADIAMMDSGTVILAKSTPVPFQNETDLMSQGDMFTITAANR